MPAATRKRSNESLVRLNYVCHILEGGLYMGGMAFLSTDAVLPKMVDSLGGTVAVMALMPVLLTASFSLAQVFVAPVVERLPRLKPWVLTFGLLQRLPYLVTGLLLLLGQNELGPWLLPIVVATPIVSGLIGGVGVVAWMEMVTRMIPQSRRASGWATRYIVSAVIGITAGPAIHQILTHRPGTDGYAWLHLIAFGFLGISFLSQIWMIEGVAEVPTTTHHVRLRTYGQYLTSLPRLLLSTPHLAKLVAVRFTGLGYLMLLGVLTKVALQETGRPEADEGYFVTCSQIGSIMGSVLAGWLGNRNGGKVLLTTARAICIAVCVWVSLTSSYASYLVAYFVIGFGLFVDRVGDLTLAAELCPPRRRSTLQALLSTCNTITLLLGAWLAGRIFSHSHSLTMVASVAAALGVISIVVLRRIPEPRHATLGESVVPSSTAEQTPS